MKILVSEKLSPKGLDYLREQGFEVDSRTKLTREELLNSIGDYDGLIVRSATQVDAALLERAEKLQVVGRAGNGIDNIDVKACTKKGVVVVNTPEANINAAAEMAVALALAIFRNIQTADRMAQHDDFRRAQLIGSEVQGKVAGIIGLGRIGALVAHKLQGLGMTVLAFDDYAAPERFERLKIKHCKTLEELLAQADLISLHTPKTKESYNMIRAEQLAQCKKGVRLVNAARGGLINEADLLAALESGQVAAAALDVADHEPNYNAAPGTQAYENPLLSHPHCLMTPHLGASTEEATENVSTSVAELVARVLQGELVAAINLPAIEGSMKELAPWIRLAKLLGSIYYQAEKKPVKKICIHYAGNLLSEETGLLTLSVQLGFLKSTTDDRLSFVNVEDRIKDLGVEVETICEDADARYQNMTTVVFETDKKKLSVGGTVFAGDRPLLVDFFGYSVDFAFAEHMIAIQNEDVPGIVGRVGTTLGEEALNISAVHWATKADHSRAESVLAVDSPPNEKVMRRLADIPGVLRVSNLEFPDLND